MECERVTTVLPWLFNGSLEAEERSQVESHLASCPACRKELRDTAVAWAATGAHPPPEVISDYGLGLEITGFPRDVLEAHLADCPSCEREAAIVLADGDEETLQGVPPEVPSSPSLSPSPSPSPSPGTSWRGWPALALAASLTAIALGGTLLWQAVKPEVPHANLAIIELFPLNAQTRGPDSEVLKLSREGPAAIVLMPGEHSVGERYRVTLRTSEGREVWFLDDIELSEVGDVALLLPTDALPEGVLGLELQVHFEGGWKNVAEYAVVVGQ
ncbi:MAG: zf-HC2 domain-containing protein [Deltaproteobacteria bacterium]|nr:zf-HC2 domain-containing protein [Deltaproteobacteria bacterium]